MKKLTTFLILLFVINLADAQKVTVSESTEVIEKISRQGMSTVIALDNKKIEKAWEKQLKSYGKVDYSKGVYTVAVANIPSVSSSPCVITSVVKNTGKGTMVWWAIDMGKQHVSKNTSSAYSAAEKILYEFAIQAYRDDKNEQIEEAEKAVATAVKAQEKKVKEGQDIVKDVENNKQEKINLEQKLKENGEKLVQLQKDIEQNKKDQATAAENVEKVRKALELKKAELGAIGK
ncbi:MAG: hypothetical protein K2X86_19095 [Cytophagaceae bacterium]|nr:hypothetical protein [Cytophagaceae bacterium]